MKVEFIDLKSRYKLDRQEILKVLSFSKFLLTLGRLALSRPTQGEGSQAFFWALFNPLARQRS